MSLVHLTLVTVAANKDFVVQLSDRRLTTPDGGIFTEDETKVVYIQTPGWQVLMGYTGLARVGRQPTNQILMELILQALKEADLEIEATMESFRSHLTEKWKSWAVRQAGVSARLSVIITGFTLHGYPNYAGPFQWLLTNYQEWGGVDHDAPWSDFTIYSVGPASEWPTLIQRVGAYQALPESEGEELRSRLAEGIPASAVRDSMLNMLPTQSLAFPTVGTRANSVIIRPYLQPEGEYHSFNEVRAVQGFDHVIANSSEEIIMVSMPTIEQVSPGDGIVTAIPRRQPCGCGSGLQYRRCHGKVPSKAKKP